MNAKMLGFFSGFPSRRFPDEIANRLRSALPVRDCLVFVSAWPSEAEQNDQDAAGMHAMFEQCGMPFAEYAVIDDRTRAADAQALVRRASCIFLMGGHATQQFRLICAKGIADEIRMSSAVVLGVSAGSCNMAVHALDIWESPIPYRGLGLAEITIKAHVTQENQELLNTLLQVTVAQHIPICAMEDNSAIFVGENGVEHIGRILWLSGGIVSPFTPELLRAPENPLQKGG